MTPRDRSNAERIAFLALRRITRNPDADLRAYAPRLVDALEELGFEIAARDLLSLAGEDDPARAWVGPHGAPEARA